MHDIKVYRVGEYPADIQQLPIKRDWMEQTHEKHAYNCFPVTLTNGIAFGLSFPEDISFMWDGISDTNPGHVKIISGHKYIYTERANATISFHTGLRFETDENLSLMVMPVPNLFIDGAQCFTTAITTSFFSGEIPCAWRITRPHYPIKIKANTPFAAVLPISISELNNSSVTIKNINELPQANYNGDEYQRSVSEILSQGKWTNFYRNAVDHKGNSIGSHEAKAIRLRVVDETK